MCNNINQFRRQSIYIFCFSFLCSVPCISLPCSLKDHVPVVSIAELDRVLLNAPDTLDTAPARNRPVAASSFIVKLTR